MLTSLSSALIWPPAQLVAFSSMKVADRLGPPAHFLLPAMRNPSPLTLLLPVLQPHRALSAPEALAQAGKMEKLGRNGAFPAVTVGGEDVKSCAWWCGSTRQAPSRWQVCPGAVGVRSSPHFGSSADTPCSDSCHTQTQNKVLRDPICSGGDWVGGC